LEQPRLIAKFISPKSLVVAATAILATGLLFVPSMLAGDTVKPVAEAEMPVFPVKVTDAEVRTLRAYLEVNGDIVSDRQVVVFPETSGKLARVLVALGSTVRQGGLIAEVNPARPARR
jgi:multidrug efflux pump subunit AcrA (membrane-fusion protein)